MYVVGLEKSLNHEAITYVCAVSPTVRKGVSALW